MSENDEAMRSSSTLVRPQWEDEDERAAASQAAASGHAAGGVAGVDAPVTEEELACAQGLVEFIEQSPSMFHAAAASAARLEAAGFTRLREAAAWELRAGGRYYVTRNNSSVIAWVAGGAPAVAPLHFQVAASHADSPTFKLKHHAVLEGPGGFLRLDVEGYGGMIDYTWFDKPLSVAGRVMVREGNRVESRLVAPARDLALIPSVAVHMNRQVNEGFATNHARDLCPVVSAGGLTPTAFNELVAAEAGVAPEAVLARDLFLVNRQCPAIWGAGSEFVSAPKLDDLACAYASLEGYLRALGEPSDDAASVADGCVAVWCCLDNEEVGSNTKQGALSTFLRDTLERIVLAGGGTSADYRRALAASMLVSCDNAHGVHPNHPEYHDLANAPRLGGGLVVKEAANQHYCTDAFSHAAFAAVCADAGVPLQAFANRSDMAGGGTLGNLSNMQASMHGIDVGLPQLAMHSSYETAAVRDVLLAVRALEAFFRANLAIDGADAVTLA